MLIVCFLLINRLVSKMSSYKAHYKKISTTMVTMISLSIKYVVKNRTASSRRLAFIQKSCDRLGARMHEHSIYDELYYMIKGINYLEKKLVAKWYTKVFS